MFVRSLLIAMGSALLPAGSASAEALDDRLFPSLIVDQLEYRLGDQNVIAWEADATIGNDDGALGLETRGELVTLTGQAEAAEVQLTYRRPLTDFFDLTIGARHDFEPDPQRYHAVIGVRGLAPQWFEVDADLYLSDKGKMSGRLELEYEALLTQRLVLVPLLETEFSFAADRQIDRGSGLNSVELGLRLHYEINRDVAPYLGVHWERSLGRTADLARAEGEDVQDAFLLAGIRLMF